MVLFREDEQRMKEQERQEKLAKRTPLGVWIRRIFKIGIVLAAFLFLSLSLLAGLEGNHPALKKGMEEYLMQATGLEAEIGEFSHMGFFPRLELDISGIVFRTGEGDTVITVGKAAVVTRFFDLMFSRRRVETLVVENLEAAPGTLADEALAIGFFGLRDDGPEGKPALVVEGRYGERDISGHASVAREDGDKGAFVLAEQSNYNLRVGEILIKGAAGRDPEGVRITIDTLEAPEQILSGSILIATGLTKNRIKADIAFGASRLQTDLAYADRALDGKIVFPVLKLADIATWKRLREVRSALPGKKGQGLIDLYAWDVDTKVEVASLESDEGALGNLKFPLTLKEQELIVGPLAGTLNDGALAGRIYMDARALPAKLSIKGALKGWKLGGGAAADIHWDLESKSRTYEGIVPALAGEIALVGGAGEMMVTEFIRDNTSGLGSGSTLPVNCLIADFKVEEGIARPQPLVIDTDEAVLAGNGTINLKEGKSSLKLEPAPAPGADAAFASFAMAELGLTESHPCRKFIAGPSVNPAP